MVRSLHCAALVLWASIASAATQGPPVYTYTGGAPSGPCFGTRVWIDALGTGTYYCNGTWQAVTSGGAGYATVQDEGTPLTARTVLNFAGAGVTCADGSGKTTCTIPGGSGTPGGASGNLQTNDGAGGFGAYAGATCASDRYTTSTDASGGLGCGQVTMAGLSATGTPNNTTWLRGDGVWSTPTFLGYTNIYDEATPLTDRSNLKFTGTGVTCTDSVPYTVCNIPGSGASDATTVASGMVMLGQAPFSSPPKVLTETASNTYGLITSGIVQSATTKGKTVEVTESGTATAGADYPSGPLRLDGSIWSTTFAQAIPWSADIRWMPTGVDAGGVVTGGNFQFYKPDGSTVAATISETGAYSGNAATATTLTGALAVNKGGLGKTTLTSAGAIPVGTAGTTTYTDLAGGAVGTILYNSAANTPAWLTNGTTTGLVLISSGGSGPSWGRPGYRVTGSNWTNGTTTVTDITGLSWAVASGVPQAFRCQMAVLNANAGSAIRYAVNGPAMTTVAFKTRVHKASVTTEVIENFTAVSSALQTAGVTSGVATTAHVDIIEGVIIPSANGTMQIRGAGSAAQTSTVYQGSSCFVW